MTQAPRDSNSHADPGSKSGNAPPIDPLEVRSNPRVGTDVPVEIYTGDFGGALMGRTRDLSIGGACVATQSPFSFKSIQRVVLTLPEHTMTMYAHGHWQRADPSDTLVLTGISFDRPEPEQLDIVWDLVLDSAKKLARFLYERTAFHELGLEEAMGLAQVTRVRTLAAGETIYRQGAQAETNDSIFLITEGSVMLQLRIRDAIEQPLAQLGVGELFGGLPLLADVPHAETAVASSDLKLLEIDAAAFRHLRSMRPWLGHRLGVALLRVHAQRMSQTLGVASNTL